MVLRVSVWCLYCKFMAPSLKVKVLGAFRQLGVVQWVWLSLILNLKGSVGVQELGLTTVQGSASTQGRN